MWKNASKSVLKLLYSTLFAVLQDKVVFTASSHSMKQHVEKELEEESEQQSHPSKVLVVSDGSLTADKTIVCMNSQEGESQLKSFIQSCFSSLFLLIKQYDAMETDVRFVAYSRK